MCPCENKITCMKGHSYFSALISHNRDSVMHPVVMNIADNQVSQNNCNKKTLGFPIIVIVLNTTHNTALQGVNVKHWFIFSTPAHSRSVSSISTYSAKAMRTIFSFHLRLREVASAMLITLLNFVLPINAKWSCGKNHYCRTHHRLAPANHSKSGQK